MSSSSGAAGYSGYYQEAPESAYAAGHGAMAYSEQSTDYAQDARQAHGFANTYNPSGPQLLYAILQPLAPFLFIHKPHTVVLRLQSTNTKAQPIVEDMWRQHMERAWFHSRAQPVRSPLPAQIREPRLASDDEDLYEGRVKLWKNFNNAWLGLLEKQKEMMWYGKKLHRSQSLVSFEDLQKMARELVRLCDGIERFGLVDYDYGVWEERIMAKWQKKTLPAPRADRVHNKARLSNCERSISICDNIIISSADF
ncbi:hypothetical protein SPBR_07382 [Sporothrix brasiliensis 5110]|uniref:Uncharacterized protein n=1 Tax=Sporothrix brasiliensis 5110 TaxID=1398154 RepID=A0A0C2IUL3_9PEZI|nr:uncharacterized protein SPBR_07382 [Sporothrix brasiliensis 5110]KIH88657.1 hypothetical protein SPBR_07382 [Sporothrix brasiliensis 5110]